MRAIFIENGHKISESNKRFYATEAGQECLKNRAASEWLKNITAANQRPKSEDTLRKVSENTTNLWQTEEYRNKVNAAREAKQAQLRRENPEWVKKKAKKMSESMKAKWADPEFAAKMKKSQRPAKMTREQIAARAAKAKATKRANWPPEKIALFELAEKEGWSNSKRTKRWKAMSLAGLKSENQQK